MYVNLHAYQHVQASVLCIPTLKLQVLPAPGMWTGCSDSKVDPGVRHSVPGAGSGDGAGQMYRWGPDLYKSIFKCIIHDISSCNFLVKW